MYFEIVMTPRINSNNSITLLGSMQAFFVYYKIKVLKYENNRVPPEKHLFHCHYPFSRDHVYKKDSQYLQ